MAVLARLQEPSAGKSELTINGAVHELSFMPVVEQRRMQARILILRNISDRKKIEEDLMKKLPQKEWDAGMAMSFLGREICRPKPECEICLMNTVCAYYAKVKKKTAVKAKK